MEKYKEVVQFIRTLYSQPHGIIPLHAPVFIGNEKKYLAECIDSTYVSSVGRFVEEFEVEMTKYTGSMRAVACINGTSALHIALKLVGVESGHEVITQSLTFVSTANAIVYCGAQPIFLDVDMDTMGLSPDKLYHWLKNNIIFKKSDPTLPSGSGLQPFNKNTGKRISACLPMHTFGHPCRIDEIVEICHKYNIPTVEDATESLGSFYKSQHTGTFGKIGILSFNGNKILTTGGGGMMLFQEEELAIQAKHLSTQAKIAHPWEISHDEIGYNYRMPNINAALGLAQFEQLGKFLLSKRMLAQKYSLFFDNTDIKFFKEPVNSYANCWLNCILFNNRKERDDFLKYSNECGVVTRPAWKLMNKLRMFKHCFTDELINSRTISDRLVNLPSSFIH